MCFFLNINILNKESFSLICQFKINLISIKIVFKLDSQRNIFNIEAKIVAENDGFWLNSR